MIPQDNQANHENLRIPLENHENYGTPLEDHENLKNPRIPSEMQEDHESPGVPFEIIKIMTILEFQSRIMKIMKII